MSFWKLPVDVKKVLQDVSIRNKGKESSKEKEWKKNPDYEKNKSKIIVKGKGNEERKRMNRLWKLNDSCFQKPITLNDIGKV